MQKLDVKIKKLVPEATIPQYSREGDVGLDLKAVSMYEEGDDTLVYSTGLAIEIPEGYYADLRARSSIASYDLVLANGVGTIDSNYRGELIFKFKITRTNNTRDLTLYEIGDRIGQMVIKPYPRINLIEVDVLTDSNRGSNGFGSSGN